jgi:hypothetical protein
MWTNVDQEVLESYAGRGQSNAIITWQRALHDDRYVDSPVKLSTMITVALVKKVALRARTT